MSLNNTRVVSCDFPAYVLNGFIFILGRPTSQKGLSTAAQDET
jgi:hypothetical protein